MEAQTFRDFEHLVAEDTDHVGCAATMNGLAAEARGQWLFLIADDDVMLPRCLQLHLDVSAAADVVYAPPLVWGEDPAQFLMGPPGIPAVALIRKALWDRLGGYDVEQGCMEDRSFWVRAEEKQARFVRAGDHPTWIYRFHRLPDGTPGNKSRR